MGMPGQQYFAGTHFNPNSTWWAKSGPFLTCLNRCQFLLQQGLFVADACYYYGDHVPNFTQLKSSDPARVLPGYDYDVITEEAILTRLSLRDGRLWLPDGMSYRVLVLPQRSLISLPVLRKLKELVASGATVIGPKPTHASTLAGFPQCDAEVAALADELWGANPNSKGRVIADQTARQILLRNGVSPDFECEPIVEAGGSGAPTAGPASLDYIHRTVGEAEIYFVANRTNRSEEFLCTFRVKGKAPEIWDPVSGQRRFARAYQEKGGRTIVPLEFNPCGSWFVVFREPAAKHPPTGRSNRDRFENVTGLSGPWDVRFDPQWGGPESAEFPTLVSWTTRPEPGIKHYSGTAVYRKQFDLPENLNSTRPLWLDLGNLRELAQVRLNGQDLGVLWAPPFRVDLSTALKPKGNQLEIDIVNFWPNRIIGDQSLPAAERLTRTNIRKLTKETALMESGLFGPVRLLRPMAAD
jgi:hypothetical protein